ncbi:hypothetical protein, partial [Enterovibrio norvegicus]|uniref:hypothetical protein n=1 Tax=Enterovibrio norvegicus TaxID=188144 RepID=UPI0039AE981A
WQYFVQLLEGGCLTTDFRDQGQKFFAFIVKRFRVFRAPLHRSRQDRTDSDTNQYKPRSLAILIQHPKLLPLFPNRTSYHDDKIRTGA